MTLDKLINKFINGDASAFDKIYKLTHIARAYGEKNYEKLKENCCTGSLCRYCSKHVCMLFNGQKRRQKI